jgi:hypothetical protein
VTDAKSRPWHDDDHKLPYWRCIFAVVAAPERDTGSDKEVLGEVRLITRPAEKKSSTTCVGHVRSRPSVLQPELDFAADSLQISKRLMFDAI